MTASTTQQCQMSLIIKMIRFKKKSFEFLKESQIQGVVYS